MIILLAPAKKGVSGRFCKINDYLAILQDSDRKIVTLLDSVKTKKFVSFEYFN